jgi:hypothetical protein
VARLGTERLSPTVQRLIGNELDRTQQEKANEIEEILRRAGSDNPSRQEAALRRLREKERRTRFKNGLVFWLSALILGGNIGALISEIPRAIEANSLTWPLLFMIGILVAALFLLWLTFDRRFIPGLPNGDNHV